jgi:hypothetical protein
MASVTLIASSPALNGQSALCRISGAEAITYLPTLAVGSQVTVGSSSKKGIVSKVYPYNNYFLINPLTQSVRVDSSSTPGVLVSGDTITIP